ncbi:acetoin utilization deacetylase AcuC-like enzyme [Desulfitobacterium sp. LBE]|uniref:Histone deacetylase 14 n=2 Tax=root TaxID=1 RepID=A0A098AZT8_DESHA|nr:MULTISPECIES: histone deacetylase [Desulfitobacterium]MEA5025713.1 histone deacetylase [Desulfitobacterium hafniense]TWH56417.1 acetoin utilization deacetylase AcuC-like enzyme [Desulfitobacterium sp. LBE]CDX01642.1 Histone deacetylase 14 [Desulfitobacterium hafniense]
MKNTGLLFFPAFDWSLGDTHPEREERLLYTQEQLFEEGVMDLPQIKHYAPGLASLKDVQRTQGIFPAPESHDLDAHLIAAGSSLVLGEAWAKKEIHNGFALVRPPGHHSGATVLGNRGFCTLNNEAILINHLRTFHGIKKVAIVDTDVHHGDGTQDIFYHDPNVLFVSIHQDGRTLYPGSGFIYEKGGPNAWETTLDIPLPPGTGDEDLHHVLESWVLPRIYDFQPDLIINSAGQDNHFTDPLASMSVTARGYGRITELLNPDLAVLEGGYSIEGALPYVNLAIVLALAGEDYQGVIEPQKPRHPHSGSNAFRGFLKELKEQYRRAKPDWNIRSDSFLPEGKWVYIPHSVYYDTEGFQEGRKDWIRQCSHCGGTVLIESQHTVTGNTFALVRIPFAACEQCTQAGYDLWEYLIGRKTSVLLQDQQHNKVELWHLDKGVTHF